MVDFTPPELEWLKLVIDGIMESDEGKVFPFITLFPSLEPTFLGEISQNTALNKSSEVQSKKMTIGEAEKILKKFKEHGWLRYDAKNESVRFSLRFIMEMEPYLRDVYGELVEDCVSCKKIVIKKLTCLTCDSVHHLYCAVSQDNTDEGVCKNKKCNEKLPISNKAKAGAYKPGPKSSQRKRKSAPIQDDSD